MVRCRNRHVTYSVNAMLNYPYAVLESQVRIASVAQGLHPTIGYLHVSRSGRAALVYDLMEPLRPLADRLILDYVRELAAPPPEPAASERERTANLGCKTHCQGKAER
jgi:CRISP-associated protein Cas1